MKSRYPSLDGLRGFAILLVVLNHINGFSERDWVIHQLPFSLLQQAYYTIASGPFGVQIFFVLSGFLISFIYADVSHPLAFIQKRYTRIYPVLITIVMFLWIVSLSKFTARTYMQVPLLFVTVVGAHVLWKYVKRTHSEKFSKGIFLVFIVIQMIVLLFALSLQLHMIHMPNMQLHNSLFMLLSNSTLTYTVLNGYGYEQIFWSLVPEALFYVLYPVVVIRLVYYGKKFGIGVSILLVLLTSFSLFSLDHVLPFFLARASSYIAGIVIGTIYSSQTTMWQKLEPLLKLPVINLCLLVLFIALLWGDLNLHIYLTPFSNFYYYISSWFISLVLLAAIIKNTILYRIFANKLLVLLGIISFPMYLIHPTTIRWNYALYLRLNKLPSEHIVVFMLIFLTTTVTTIAVSYCIHKFV